MNLTNLKSGDVIANYSKMCDLLEEPERAGSPRNRQLEDWKRYFNYTKQGHKFVIVEIYTAPAPKIDGRSKGNNSVYIQPASYLLFNEIANLASQESNEGRDFVELTNQNIKLLVGLCNERYGVEDEKLFNKMVANREITLFDKQDFYRRANSKHREIIESIFKNLKNNNKCTEIVGSYKVLQDEELRLSTKYEENLIGEVSALVLSEFDVPNISSIYLKNKQKAFYKRVNDLLQERHKLEVSYKTNLLFFNSEIILDETIYNLSEDEKMELKSTVNKAIKDFLDDQAVKNIIKNKSKNQIEMIRHNASYGFFNDKVYKKHDKKRFAPCYSLGNPYKGYRLHEYYLDSQRVLSDLLIKLID